MDRVMNRVAFYLFIACVILMSSPSFSKPTSEGEWLNGTITTYDSIGKEIPWAGNVIEVYYENDKYRTAATTGDQGNFHLRIKKPMVLGRKVRFNLKVDDYFILSPYNGEFFPPESLTNFDLKIKVVSNSSKAVQVGPLYANFTNKDRKKAATQKQLYTVQVVSTTSSKESIKIRNFFVSNGYDSFIDTIKETYGLVTYKVYVTTSTDWETTNKVKRKIRRRFKRKYKDSFVKSILVTK